jgi:hypothetical protein
VTRFKRYARSLPLVVLAVAALTVTQSAEGQKQKPPAIQPVHVIGGSGAYLNVSCPFTTVIYTVPAGKLLLIEDASASAVSAANPSGIDPTIDVQLGLITNIVEGLDIGRSFIVQSIGVPMGGGRTMRAYAGPETDVHFSVGGCPANVNATVSFSGQLVDFAP